MAKKKVLLIGGAGYVGTVLASHLLKENYKVRVLDQFLYENQYAVQQLFGDPDFELIKGDLVVKENLERALEGISDVIILGGLVGDPITKKYPDESNAINDAGIKNCIDFLDERNLDKVVFVSTCSNYGLIGDNELADEDFKLNPLSLYATAKVEAEKHLLAKKNKVDYTGVILRFATAFGISPRMRFDLTVNEFVRDLYFGKELLVYDKDTWRPYCHVRDFARLISLVLESEKNPVNFEVFNAGGDVNNFTKQMIVDEILEKIPDGNVEYKSIGSDPRNYRVSFKKVKDTLGFEPEFTVEGGITELIEAFEIGLYSDSLKNKDKYGNYSIQY